MIVVSTGAFRYCDGITDVYYCGDEEQWANIDVKGYNETLTGATIHYNSHNWSEWKVMKEASTSAVFFIQSIFVTLKSSTACDKIIKR